ncbi:MAG: exonuclease domain-containing protein [Planctomycetota bacterium]
MKPKPPGRCPLDPSRRLDGVDFVAFDFETTGCTASTDAIVEAGAVRFRLGSDGVPVTLDRFESLVDPGRPIPPEVIRVHGITDADVAGQPPIADVLPRLEDFFGDAADTLLMAHNASFDLAFLAAAHDSVGRPRTGHVAIDTVRLSRRLRPALPGHSLRSLKKSFHVEPSRAHRGLDDAAALAAIFAGLVTAEGGPSTLADLFRLTPPRPIPTRIPTGPFGRSRPAPPPPDDPRVDPTLSAALATRRRVSFVYDAGSRSGARRDVTPDRIVHGSTASYLVAFCHRDGVTKQYRLDRIRECVGG